jgi:diguanylate cyclase (GGDEF)-like protein/PAS domain S-box-containing protein
MTPLVIQGDVHGMLVLASETGLPDACQDALAALGIDVALALDSRALADAVHQHHSDARLAALVQHASDVLIVINAEGVVRYVSGSVTRIMGYTPAEVIDTLRPDLVHPEDLPVVQRHMATVLSTTGATPPLEVRMRHRDGRWVSLELIASNLLHVPQVEGLLLTCRDITERKVLEARLTHQAFHDALTNLPNRALFMDRVAHALRRAARHAQGVAVLFLDVDRFKTINDSLGHAAGDHLLRAVAERIHACVRPEDTLARLGGDEFTILLDNSADRAMATDVAERILTALQAPICINGHEIVISASIGIVCSGTESTTPDDLLRYADIAMYQAKSAGKGRYLVFDHAMNAHALERLELEHDLRRAIELDELRVYYQPIVDLRTAQMTGLEALARWQHPAHGLVAPAHFIPLAEETGLIVPLGRWVLETACRQVRHWQAHHPHARTLEVSVNLSARQFRDAQLVGDVAQILADTQLLPACLKLEITESVVMDVADAAAATLQELKALGIQLAIDDFGTGYSSLSYLKRFAVDTLKIDRAFVAGVGQDVEDTAIVRAVTTLAHSLGLSVTAEGVETAAVVAHLHALGCTAAQGYFFAKPLPSDAIPRLLDQISDPTVEAALPWRGPPHAGTPASSAVGTPCGAAVDNTVRSQPASTVERSRVLPAAECTDDPPAHHL